MVPTGVRPEGGPLSQENAGQRPRGPRCPSPHPAGPGALSPCRHQHWPGLGAAKPQEEAGPSPESAHPRLLCSAQRQCRPLGGVSGLWERGQSVAVAAGSPSRYGPHITELWGDGGRLGPAPCSPRPTQPLWGGSVGALSHPEDGGRHASPMARSAGWHPAAPGCFQGGPFSFLGLLGFHHPPHPIYGASELLRSPLGTSSLAGPPHPPRRATACCSPRLTEQSPGYPHGP